MVALQTMKSINKDMSQVQDQISTGKRIANAWDNAALWGISKTMETDVSGFKAISESLSLGSATLSVGRDAAETITGLLDQLKGKIVAAQEQNVDRNKIQADVDALSDQIQVITRSSQFNGLNLLSSTDSVNVLASLNRDNSGTVTSDSIKVTSQNLTTTTGEMGAGGVGTLESNV
jgi:flagellin